MCSSDIGLDVLAVMAAFVLTAFVLAGLLGLEDIPMFKSIVLPALNSQGFN
jgi:hypothetical protein